MKLRNVPASSYHGVLLVLVGLACFSNLVTCRESCEAKGCSHECRMVAVVKQCDCAPGRESSPGTYDGCGEVCSDTRCEEEEGGACLTEYTEPRPQCVCPTGFVLDPLYDTKCIDIDECAEKPCEMHCLNQPGSFTCACDKGYFPNSTKCENINECATVDNPCPQLCLDTAGSFQCACYEGYRLSDSIDENTGVPACLNVNECSEGSHDCEQTCGDVRGSYVCSCRAGYVIHPLNKFKCLAVEEYDVNFHFDVPGETYSGQLQNSNSEDYSRLAKDMSRTIREAVGSTVEDVLVTNISGSVDVTSVFKIRLSHDPLSDQDPAAVLARLLLRIAETGLELPAFDEKVVPDITYSSFQVLPHADVCDVRDTIKPCDEDHGLYCDFLGGGACQGYTPIEDGLKRGTIIVVSFCGACLLLIVCFLAVCLTHKHSKNDKKKPPFGNKIGNKIHQDVYRVAAQENGFTSVHISRDPI